jgi:hypothetical protein
MEIEILAHLNTDQLWKLMPPHVHYDGDDYFFSASRGSMSEIIEYKTKSKKALFNTYRSNDTLKDTLYSMLYLLLENDLLTKIQLERLISEL